MVLRPKVPQRALKTFKASRPPIRTLNAEGLQGGETPSQTAVHVLCVHASRQSLHLRLAFDFVALRSLSKPMLSLFRPMHEERQLAGMPKGVTFDVFPGAGVQGRG